MCLEGGLPGVSLAADVAGVGTLEGLASPLQWRVAVGQVGNMDGAGMVGRVADGSGLQVGGGVGVRQCCRA